MVYTGCSTRWVIVDLFKPWFHKLVLLELCEVPWAGHQPSGVIDGQYGNLPEHQRVIRVLFDNLQEHQRVQQRALERALGQLLPAFPIPASLPVIQNTIPGHPLRPPHPLRPSHPTRSLPAAQDAPRPPATPARKDNHVSTAEQKVEQTSRDVQLQL